MNKHQDCKFFGYRTCTHKDDEIMREATQTIPEYRGGNFQILKFPSDEKIDVICSTCKKFSLK
jgi:hypothetical protein